MSHLIVPNQALEATGKLCGSFMRRQRRASASSFGCQSREAVMRAIYFILALLSAVDVMAVDEPDTAAATPYMRCAAINYLLHSTPKARQTLPHQNFKLYMELHAKWAWIPYGGNYPRYKADYDSTMKGLQAELRTKSLSGEAFGEEVKSCLSLQLHTMDSFLACLRGSGETEENKQVCARKAIGL